MLTDAAAPQVFPRTFETIPVVDHYQKGGHRTYLDPLFFHEVNTKNIQWMRNM